MAKCDGRWHSRGIVQAGAASIEKYRVFMYGRHLHEIVTAQRQRDHDRWDWSTITNAHDIAGIGPGSRDALRVADCSCGGQHLGRLRNSAPGR